MNNLIVYCEIEDGIIADVSLELLTKGRSLANQLNCKLEALVIGSNLDGVEKQVFPYGVDTVYTVDDPRLYPYTSLPHTSVLVNLFKEQKPQVCLMGATSIGRDLGPRVSSSLHSGLTADCTALEIGPHEDKKNNKTYENLLYQIRPAFGGNIVATIVNPECRPQMATVREEKIRFRHRLCGRSHRSPDGKIQSQRQRRIHHRSRRLRYGIERKLRHAVRLGGYIGSRGRSFPRCGRRRIHRARTSNRTNRCHGSPQALYRLRYLWTDTTHRRYARQLHHHLYQQRS